MLEKLTTAELAIVATVLAPAIAALLTVAFRRGVGAGGRLAFGSLGVGLAVLVMWPVLSELLASPESPRPASSCAFSSQLLSQASNVRELELPPDSGVVAGYQLTALEPIAVPAGWQVHQDESVHAGPYTLQGGVTATVWAPLECRPLPPAGSGQSPDEFRCSSSTCKLETLSERTGSRSGPTTSS